MSHHIKRRGGETYPQSPNAGGGVASLARGWASQGSTVDLSNLAAVNVISVTVTPNVTGFLRVIVTGKVRDTSGNANSLLVYLGHGVLDPAENNDFSITSSEILLLDANSEAQFPFVVDMDKLPVIFPVGTPVTLAVAIQTGAGTAHVAQNCAQIEVQEVF